MWKLGNEDLRNLNHPIRTDPQIRSSVSQPHMLSSNGAGEDSITRMENLIEKFQTQSPS
jgi:hypothetical protein